MLRLQKQLAVLVLICLGGCFGTADRLLTVRADKAPNSTSAEPCVMRLVDQQGRPLAREQVVEQGKAAYVNPPSSGQFFVDVSCGRSVKRYGPYLFEKDHQIELGDLPRS